MTFSTRLGRARQLANSLLNVIFPPTCAGCRRVGALLCDSCINEMTWVDGPICARCGRSLTRPAPLCPICRRRPLPLQQVRAPLLYAEPLTHVIHKMKYNGLFGLARPLADLMARGWPAWQRPIDLLVPVPLHPKRAKERGYNQSTLLAQHLGRRRDLPVNDKALRRTRHTRPQVGLKADERLANVSGAFAATAAPVHGKHVLLIDDVYTTGATMSAAAEALLTVGATAVSGYCLARAA